MSTTPRFSNAFAFSRMKTLASVWMAPALNPLDIDMICCSHFGFTKYSYHATCAESQSSHLNFAIAHDLHVQLAISAFFCSCSLPAENEVGYHQEPAKSWQIMCWSSCHHCCLGLALRAKPDGGILLRIMLFAINVTSMRRWHRSVECLSSGITLLSHLSSESRRGRSAWIPFCIEVGQWSEKIVKKESLEACIPVPCFIKKQTLHQNCEKNIKSQPLVPLSSLSNVESSYETPRQLGVASWTNPHTGM